MHLRDGHLVDEAATATTGDVSIHLTPSKPAVTADELRAMLGVIAVREGAGADVVLTVALARSDEVLRSVLDRGWSVRSVRPAYGSDDELGS